MCLPLDRRRVRAVTGCGEKDGARVMVTYADVGKRHIIYATAMLEVLSFAEYTLFLAFLLAIDAGIVCWHMNTPVTFAAVAAVCTPLATSICVTLSHHTWWYAHGMSVVGIPLWLCPLHCLFAHWALDAYWLVTLRDVRKSTLPGMSA
jgi:hypothetical protein